MTMVEIDVGIWTRCGARRWWWSKWMVSSILAFAVLKATKPTIKGLKMILLEITDEPCYQLPDWIKNKFIHYNFYDGCRIFYDNPCNDNQCNSTKTDEDFVICWVPEDEILPNDDDDNNPSDHDIGSTVPPLTKKQRWCNKNLSAIVK